MVRDTKQMHGAPSLASALVAAQRAAEAVQKDAENRFHGYAYASAEAIMAEARAALNQAGLATIMSGWELLPPTHAGADARVKCKFLTVHDASGDQLPGDAEYAVIPEKGRPFDKATATALTYAEGYYLRGLLCLPRVDRASEVDARDDRGREPAKPPAAAAKDSGTDQPRGAKSAAPAGGAVRSAAGRPAPDTSAASKSAEADAEPAMGSRGQASMFHGLRTRLGWSEDDARAWFAGQDGTNGCTFLSETPHAVVSKVLDTMKGMADKVSPPAGAAK